MSRTLLVNLVSVVLGLGLVLVGLAALSDSDGFGLPFGGFELEVAGILVFVVGGMWSERD